LTPISLLAKIKTKSAEKEKIEKGLIMKSNKEEPQLVTTEAVCIKTTKFKSPVVTKGVIIIVGGQRAVQDSETAIWILNPNFKS